MPDHAEVGVTTANGLRGVTDRDQLSQASPAELVNIRLEDGQQLWVMPSSLVAQTDGRYFLPVAVPQRPLAARAEAGDQPSETTIIPVIEEEAVVAKRAVESGVRVTKRVQAREEPVQVPVRQERIDVRREPANEFVSEPEAARQEGDTWIVPVYEEVLVVEKRLRLRERVYVTKRATTTEQGQPVTLRREEVIVEPLGDTPSPGGPTP